jgi:hypothetical protein
MKRLHKRFALLSLLLMAPWSAFAGRTGTAVRDLDLLAEPRAGTKLVSRLQKSRAYEILKNEKSWSQVAA